MPLSPETLLEIKQASHHGGHLPPGYAEFLVKWMAFNRAYNESETVKGDWKKVASFAEKHQDRWDEVAELAKRLLSIECIGSEYVEDSSLVAPNQSVKSATIFLREKLGLVSETQPTACSFAGCIRKEKQRICNQVNFQPWTSGEVAALLRLVYQVRCNLMHGEKRLYGDNFQTNRDRVLIALSSQILDRVLNWFLP